MATLETATRETASAVMRTTASLRRQKERGEKIVSLTCYDYSTARMLDAAGVDFFWLAIR